ncbi:unnamed protein product, partial [Mesorhabditis belari]|uniref:Ion transport domain-containing protein n=1 Tax=Mesorhabditis belari TaxID=2138241 RepID=A0AAF3F4N9_9BILA
MEAVHGFTPPHNPKCSCKTCFSNRLDLEYQNKRLQAYEQTTSIEYIRATFERPFRAAVDHCADLKKASESTNVHRKRYADLYKGMCSILQKMMKSQEVNINNFLDVQETINHEPHILRKLLEQENMEVITHFKMQHWLSQRWEASFADYFSLVRWLILCLAWFFPPMFSVFGAFELDFAKALRVRWNSHLSSHFCFFILLLLRLFWDERGTSLRAARFNDTFVVELTLGLFVMSHLIILMVRLSHRGIKSFMKDWWNWVEMCIVINGINFFVASSNIALQNQNALPMNVNRRHIPSTDHVYMCEFSLSLMILLMVVRFAYFVQMTYRFGRLIVAVSQCAKEYLRSLLVLFIFFMGYAFAIYGVLHPFATKPEDRRHDLTKNNGFQVYTDDFLDTAANLYWNLLSLVDEGYGQIHAGFTGPNQTPVQPFLSILFSKFLMVSFYVFIVVALLNVILTLMIMQAESYKTMGDENWAFARTRIIIDYFNYEMAAPPPFTCIILLLTTIRMITTLVKRILRTRKMRFKN